MAAAFAHNQYQVSRERFKIVTRVIMTPLYSVSQKLKFDTIVRSALSTYEYRAPLTIVEPMAELEAAGYTLYISSCLP